MAFKGFLILLLLFHLVFNDLVLVRRISLDVVLPSLFIYAGLNYIEFLAVFLGLAFSFFPFIDGGFGLVFIDVFDGLEVSQLYQFHLPIILLCSDVLV